jgi:hypothetical protein
MEATETKLINTGLLYSFKMSCVRIEDVNQSVMTPIRETKPIIWGERILETNEFFNVVLPSAFKVVGIESTISETGFRSTSLGETLTVRIMCLCL